MCLPGYGLATAPQSSGAVRSTIRPCRERAAHVPVNQTLEGPRRRARRVRRVGRRRSRRRGRRTGVGRRDRRRRRDPALRRGAGRERATNGTIIGPSADYNTLAGRGVLPQGGDAAGHRQVRRVHHAGGDELDRLPLQHPGHRRRLGLHGAAVALHQRDQVRPTSR